MLNKKPLISVIVPIYNTAERLEACLDSLLAQKMTDIELILVNDGSSDRSPEICREYRNRYPDRIHFLTGPNGGVCAARNRGLDAASGEWIAFCDSDDRTDPELYSTLLSNAVGAGADLSCCALRDIGETSQKIVIDFPYQGTVVIDEQEKILSLFFLPLLLGSSQSHGYLPCCLFRRELVEATKIRFTEGINMLEDELFLLEYLLQVRILIATDRPLYDYLRFQQSACTKYYRKRSDFFRERNWFMRAKKQWEIFSGSIAENRYPHLIPELRLRIYFHEVQMICCDFESGWSARLKRLNETAGRAKSETLQISGSGKIFWFFLLHCYQLLPLLCFAKRKKDEITRKYFRKKTA